MDYLRQVGIDPLTLGASTIQFLRLSVKERVVECALPFAALSLSRCVLDEALLARAAAVGCTVERGASVERINAEGDRWSAQMRSGEARQASTVFLANGKHDLRGLERGPGAQNDLAGFKLHWKLAASQTEALRNCMDLCLFPGGYGGLSLVEEEMANFCLVVRHSVLRGLGGWDALLKLIREKNPHIGQRLNGANALWDRPLAVSSIPYGYLATRASGLWRLGDQAAVIPSFTGDGMSIALHSATLAAEMVLAGQNAEQYQRRLRIQLAPRMRLATWLSRAMVTGVGRAVAPLGLSVFPNSMRWIASATRIPDGALCGSS